MTDERLLLLVNSAADHDDVEAAAAVLGAAAQVERRVTERAEDCETALDDLDGRLLVLAGGDGTFSTVIGMLHATERLTGTDLGLLPMGTGNDLARGLGLPLDPAEAARVVLETAPRPLDLMTDDLDRVVVNVVHAGIGAQAARTSAAAKEHLGRIAYPVGAALTGLTYTEQPVRVEVDDDVVHDGPALMVVIANGSTIGGGTVIAPAAAPDDGELDVVVIGEVPPPGRVALAARLQEGAHGDHPQVRTARGRRVTLTGGPIGLDADGELLDERSQATYTIAPGAWSARVPPPT